MKHVKTIFTLVVFVLDAITSASALAWHGGGHVRFGVYVGPSFWYPPPYYGYPPYYYAPYYYSPAFTAPASRPSYIEQGGAQPPPALPQVYWYYCGESKTYYPYVRECPGGWQRVASQPPDVSRD